MTEVLKNNAETLPGNHPRKSAVVIIGAGFGDEGKGLLTDFHASQYGKDCIVARFNGGAQAGHTVVMPDGCRHIHSHFGSGTLAGAATFLSKHFVSNPLLFRREARELEKLGVSSPVVYTDERGLVTTPYDMLINQWAELARGSSKHGSCGVGFGETIERSLDEQYSIRVSNLPDTANLKTKLDRIRREWTPTRLNKLNIPNLSNEQKELLFSGKLCDDFLEAAAEFYARIQIARPDILKSANVVFEGAQGLLLDEDYGWFPNVTRSSTGLKNAVQLAIESGIKHLDCIYVTRAYATRHGAGILPHELPTKPYSKIEDKTNIPNPHQDSLRFGWLDLDLLSSTINKDYARYESTARIKVTKQLAVTCLDQLDESAFYISENKLCETTVDEFIEKMAQVVDSANIYTSHGQTRATISKVII